MTKKLPIVGVQDAQTCARCMGQCCKGTPGASDPMDLLDGDGDLDGLTIFEMFSSGDWVLGFWDGDPRDEAWGDRRRRGLDHVSIVYFPRPAYKKKSGELFEQRFDWDLGGCTFLTDKGCKLEFEARPYGCRTLVPGWDEIDDVPACRHLNGYLRDNHRAALHWLSHQEKLKAIAREVEPGGFW
jgi:hypothetical protein